MTTETSLQQALDLVRQGNLDAAERALLQLLRQGATPEIGHALDRVAGMKALYLMAAGRLEDARRVLAHYLTIVPRGPTLMGAYESLLAEIPTRLGEERGRLVLGAGTGRSGSTSLTQLLAAQPGGYFSHEHAPRLSWDTPDPRFDFHLRRFQALQRGYQSFGDVSHWWLPRFEALLEAFPDLRMIVLKRDRLETIASFLKVKGGEGQGGINHWIDHDGRFWRRNIWDECYPKYEARGSREAIGAYWDDYYRQAEALQRRFPASLRVFPTTQLSSTEGQRHILSFAGFSEPVTIETLAANAGTIKDGQNTTPALFPAA